MCAGRILERRASCAPLHGSTPPAMGELPALPCASAVGDASPAEGSCMEARPRRWGNCRHFPARRRSGVLPRLRAPCMEARPRRWGNCRHFPARRRSGMLPRLRAPCMEARPRRWGNCRHFPARRRSGMLPRLRAPGFSEGRQAVPTVAAAFYGAGILGVSCDNILPWPRTPPDPETFRDCREHG